MKINRVLTILIFLIFSTSVSLAVSIEEIRELFEEAQFDEVVKKVSKLLEKEEDLTIIAEALYYRGLAYQSFDKMIWALEDLKTATQFDSGNLLYLRTLGQLYFEFEMEDDAKYAFSDALAVDPDDMDSLIGLGFILLTEGELVASYNHLIHATEVGDVPSQVYANLGYIDMQWNNLKSAEKYLIKAIELDDENYNARFTLGMVLIVNEDYIRASDTLLKVVQNDPEDIEAKILLARAYEGGGFYQAAKTQLEEVIQQDPDNENVKAWLEKLKTE